MADWDADLTPEERDNWQAFVKHSRETATKIDQSAFVMSLVPDQVDVKFAVELGLSIMYDKPIVAVVTPGVKVPEKLRQIADEIVEIEADIDTEEGRAELERKVPPLLKRFNDDGE